MIDLQQVVYIVLYILIAGAIFGLLLFLVDYIGKQFPSELMTLFVKIAKVILVVLAILVVIGILLNVVGGQPIFRWGGKL
jgi:hypothetical protein